MPKTVQEHLWAFGGKVAPNWNTMLKLAYALHKLRVKHATRRTIHLEDSVGATQYPTGISIGCHRYYRLEESSKRYEKL